MKWVRFKTADGYRFGRLSGDRVVETSLSWSQILSGKTPDNAGERSLGDVDLAVPIGPPRKIVAIGQNYLDHCREQNVPPPEKPIIFAKFPSSLIGPGEAIRWQNSVTQQADLEVELGVVIGRTARSVDEGTALEHVFGYTVVNDVSARDVQFGDGQWVRGKSLDTFCPVGPCVVTRDEIPDPQNLALRSELNGQTMQDSNTSEMAFGVAAIVAYCSRSFTLNPGDILLTGTPDGVGVFRDPQVFLQDGDRVACEIEGIGRLENTCVVEK